MTDHNARQAGLIEAADFIANKADTYAREHGVSDMGSLSFGNDDMRDYHWGLLELADEIRALAAHSADARNGEAVALTDMRWRDVSVEKPTHAQQVLFVRNGKVHFGAWINDIFWYSNEKVCALYWMPLPEAPTLAAPAAPAPKLTPHTADVEQMLDCDEAAPAPAAQADERELYLYDEIECDLPALFGRASTEGHEAGQALAAQLQAKMRKARQQSATPAECTCPSGNGSLRHPCPAHSADPASEADKRDAERYRWLRAGHRGCYNTIMIYAGAALDDALDEAIRAAMSREQSGGEPK